MTFVLGFKCADGVVLCTDSLEADGITKRSVNKTRLMGTTDWGVAIAGAGAPGMIDKFGDEVSAAIGRGPYNRKLIERTIEETLSQFRSQYQEDDDRFRILAGVYCVKAGEYRLYRSDGSHLAPIKDHAHIGTGHPLWRFFAENLYISANSVEDNSRLAIFIMQQAIKYVDGVDGPIRLVTYTFGSNGWKEEVGPFFGSLHNWLDGYRHCEVERAIKKEWSSSVPPTFVRSGKEVWRCKNSR